MNKLLEIRNLRVFFSTDSLMTGDPNIIGDEYTINDIKFKIRPIDKLKIKAVDDLSFDLYEGEVLGIAGESGSGKSVTAHSIINLIPSPPGKILSGKILYKGKDILSMNENELRKIRGKEIGMVFQEPMVSLNPVLKIKSQIYESLNEDGKFEKKELGKKALELLTASGIINPGIVMNSYPHQLSGGMRQRVMIAIALSRNPALLIADEPTTSLDVTIQKQILDLLLNIKKSRNDFSIILITHNLGIIKQVCSRVIIMYGGKIQEIADIDRLFSNPLHPYTQGLINCFPDPNKITANRISEIPGNVPDASEYPSGCKFHPRCKAAFSLCNDTEPELIDTGDAHFVRCHLYKNNKRETDEQ